VRTVAGRAQREAQVVRHAQQLPKVHPWVGGNDAVSTRK
jgi:hypothetical protein